MSDSSKPLCVPTLLILLLFLCSSCAAIREKTEGDVPYVPTPPKVVHEMLKMAQVTKDDVVYDLGCGDGRIVIAAARDFGARAVGVEIDQELIVKSTELARQAGVSDRATFIKEDIFKTDIREATVVAIFLLPGVNQALIPNFLGQLKPGSRIVSHMFDMGEWQPDLTRRVDSSTIYFWIVPADVHGEWEVTFEDGALPYSRLSFSQAFQKARGSAAGGKQKASVRGAAISGKEVTFVTEDRIAGKKQQLEWSATVEGSGMTGSVRTRGAPGGPVHRFSARKLSEQS